MGINTIFLIKMILIVTFILSFAFWEYRASQSKKVMSWNKFVKAVDELNEGRITQEEFQELIKNRKGE